MKILLAVHHFPPNYTGGAEWRAFRTARALQSHGHTVKVVSVERIDSLGGVGMSFQRHMAWKDELYEDVQVRRLFYNIKLAPDESHWEYDNLWLGDHFNTLFDEFQPDLFHLIGGYLISGRPLWVAQQRSIPTVLTLTDFWFLCKRVNMLRSNGHVSTLPIRPVTCAQCIGEEKRRFRWPGYAAPALMRLYWHFRDDAIARILSRQGFLRQVLNHTDVIISPSQFLRNVFISEGVDPDRIIFSRQGRNLPDLDQAVFDRTTSDVLRVGYLGQITRIKGVHVLLDAVQKIPDVPLVVSVYGDTKPFPAYTRTLERYASRDARIQLRGTYPSGSLTRVMSDLDVVVVPSLWYENSPNSILEAFAHCVPVVASDMGGMAELVQHEQNGLLFKPGDSRDLSKQLKRLASEPGLLDKLRQGILPVRTVADELTELEGLYCQAIQIHRQVCKD